MRADVPLLLLLTGCGPLADGAYRGDVLFTLQGTVYATDETAGDEDLRVALFWARDDGARTEQAVVLTTDFPARYVLEVYAPPPERALLDVPWDDGHRYAVGAPLLYLDTDGNSRWDGDEALVGATLDLTVVYAEPTHSGRDTPAAEGLQTGFQRILTAGLDGLCADAAAPLPGSLPPADHPTDLYVGDWGDKLNDLDCDGKLDEWSELCASDPEACGKTSDPK